MNYLGWASFGVFNATSNIERAHLFSSWGLMSLLPAPFKRRKLTQIIGKNFRQLIGG